jgi:Mrp family chromosome partitioning ATPase/capsular polysaccharide biosynthesis protein
MAESDSPVQTYVGFVRRQALLLVLVPLIAAGVAAFATSRATSVYRAEMKVVVLQAGGQTQADIGSQALSQTMKNLLESDTVARQTIRRLRLDTTPDDLLKKVHVSFQPDSGVLDVSYDSTSKSQAVVVLGEISRAFERTVDRKLGVHSGSSTLRQPSAAPVVIAKEFDPPHLKPGRVSPTPVKSMAFAGALGLALALVLAFARESLDARIRNRREAETWFGAPVLASLPKGACGKPPPELRRGHRNPATIEASRVLAANFQFSPAGVNGPAVLVTSALREEGKTTVAANLAAALALAGKDVIGVEADLRRPRLHRHFGVEPEGIGLADVLSGEASLEHALRPVDIAMAPTNGGSPGARPIQTNDGGAAGRLWLIPSGRMPSDPASLLTQEAVERVLGQLRSRADYVIVDAPPLLAVADALPLALQCDTVLVVGRQGRTTKDKAEAVRATLEGLGVRHMAVVVTEAPHQVRYAYA